MTSKIQCITIYPSEREKYPHWYSKTELKKMKLMPKINVKPVALVNRKYYESYYLYDINKTTVFKLTYKQKNEVKKRNQINKLKKTCSVCKKIIKEKDRCYDYHKECFLDYICKNCYDKIYEEQQKEYINNLMNDNIICLDVEATGLDLNIDEVLQVSVINSNGDILINEYCKPEHKENWEESTYINGITPEQVKDCKYYKFYQDKIQKLIDEADVIVGYNIYFDLGLLKCNYKNKKIIDVMKIFSYVYGEWSDYHKSYKWQKLINCASYYNYEFNAHDSLEDIKATLYCYPRASFDYIFNIYDYIGRVK